MDSPRPHILIVEDDAPVATLFRQALAFAGYTVAVAEDGRTALDAAQERPPDLVLLDVQLPFLDGYEVCRRLRQTSGVPILMVTARTAVPDRVRGLDVGADDYLTKPVDLEELQARVRALLRRRPPPAEAAVLQGADLTLDTAGHQVWRGGQRVIVTALEFAVLRTMLQAPGRVYTRTQLLQAAWPNPTTVDPQAVTVLIGSLRRKLEAGGATRLLHTLRGHGYVLREPDFEPANPA